MGLRIHQGNKMGSIILMVVALLLVVSGCYFLLLTLAPNTPVFSSSFEKWNEPIQQPKVGDNRLYIPKIKINIAYAAGGEEVLNDKSWWRQPERGNPVDGGNFILSAHRFAIGLTPGETVRKSPFYHLDKLQPGDHVYVDYEGKRYQYRIEKRFDVKPTQVEIEAPSEEAKMTLYTCMLAGSEAGRDVLIAKQIKADVDPGQELAE